MPGSLHVKLTAFIHRYDFPQWKFSLYFLAVLPEGVVAPTPGSKEAETFLWNFEGTCLELTHNHGTESDPQYKVCRLPCFRQI
jgi:lactoylglutathione lyase